jgi:hypothetical protein
MIDVKVLAAVAVLLGALWLGMKPDSSIPAPPVPSNPSEAHLL